MCVFSFVEVVDRIGPVLKFQYLLMMILNNAKGSNH